MKNEVDNIYLKIYTKLLLLQTGLHTHIWQKKRDMKEEYLVEQEMWKSYEQSKTVLPPDTVWVAGPGSKKEQLLKHSSTNSKATAAYSRWLRSYV